MITGEISAFLDLQNLGYVATVSPDQRPNVSPKGTIICWDSKTLAFADICSPDTVKNLQGNPNVEINVIDPILRRGYLFQGRARILDGDDALSKAVVSRYRDRGVTSPIRSIIMVDVSQVSQVLSPLYHMGLSEEEIKSKWIKHFREL